MLNRIRRTRASLTGMMAVLTLSVAACGGDTGGSGNNADAEAAEKGGLEQVTFQLNWVPGGFNAGFALAREKGYYEDEGLFVSIVPGNGSATTAQLVASGNADLAYADAVPVTQLVAKDAPIKVISTLYQSPPAQVTALADSGIESLDDLEGKTVATATGAAEAPLLPLLFEANDIDPKSVDIAGTPKEALVPQLLQENVDAILGSMDFYGIQLSDRGVETVDFPFYEHGVATVSTSIVASNSFLEERPDVAEGFVAASLKGWAEALENPDAAIEALVALFPDVDAEQAKKELAATEELFCANEAEYIGKASPEAWERHQEVLQTVGSLPEGVDPTNYYTYDYLPDDSELTTC